MAGPAFYLDMVDPWCAYDVIYSCPPGFRDEGNRATPAAAAKFTRAK